MQIDEDVNITENEKPIGAVIDTDVVDEMPHANRQAQAEYSILDREDIRGLVDNLSIDPRPVGEHVSALRTNQALLVRALSGSKNSDDFTRLAGSTSTHIRDVLTAMSPGPANPTSKAILDKLDELNKDPEQKNSGKGIPIPAFLRHRGKPDFGDSALFAEEACSRHTLYNHINRAANGDSVSKKAAVNQMKNLRDIHEKMGKRNTEGMRDRMKKTHDELKKAVTSLAGMADMEEISKAMKELIDSIMRIFSRLTGKAKGQQAG